MFPHDKVLQRMIQEEFKNNQIFMYPEEYDLRHAQTQKALKKNFLYNEIMKWKKTDDAAGDLANAEQRLQNFIEGDIDDRRDDE